MEGSHVSHPRIRKAVSVISMISDVRLLKTKTATKILIYDECARELSCVTVHTHLETTGASSHEKSNVSELTMTSRENSWQQSHPHKVYIPPWKQIHLSDTFQAPKGYQFMECCHKHIYHFKQIDVYMFLTLQDLYLGGWPDAQDVLVTGEKELPEMTVFCGSCGWGAYQLETEEKMGSWVVVSASAKCMEEILRGENFETSSALQPTFYVWLAFEFSLAIWSLMSSEKKGRCKINALPLTSIQSLQMWWPQQVRQNLKHCCLPSLRVRA